MKTENKKLQLKVIQETEGNPNVMDGEVFGGLVGSMRKKGWYFEPATVWEYEPDKYRAISGHKRIQAAIQAGILETTVRVICDPEYTEAQARLDLLEANHRQGSDDEILSKRFIESIIGDLDIDIDEIIESTGLSDAEVDDILNFSDGTEDNGKDDEVPEVKKTDIKLGDIFQLGEHRIMCGDSTKIEDVAVLMGGAKADMVFTSPPYNSGNADFTYEYKTKKTGGFYANNKDDMSFEEYYNFCIAVLNSIFTIMKGKHSVFWNVGYNANSRDSYGKIIFSNDNPFRVRETIIWNKESGFPIAGSNILSRQCEFIFLLSNSEKYLTNQHNKTIYWNRWDIPTLGAQDIENNHKACYPVSLPEKAIIDFSKRDMIICDLFLGTGSTLIACEKTRRKCYGMEIEPLYIQTTIDRWENFTGLAADVVKQC